MLRDIGVISFQTIPRNFKLVSQETAAVKGILRNSLQAYIKKQKKACRPGFLLKSLIDLPFVAVGVCGFINNANGMLP